MEGLRQLSGGSTPIEVGSQKLLAAFQKLGAGEQINALGTFQPLEWNDQGAVAGGNIEVWCIGGPSSAPVYQSSGLSLDLETQRYAGAYAPCGP